MWLQTDKSCENQRWCWSRAGWVTAHPKINAHIFIFLPPLDRANFLYLTPQALKCCQQQCFRAAGDAGGWHCCCFIQPFTLTPALTNIPGTPSHCRSHSAGWAVPLRDNALQNCRDLSHPSLPKATSPCLDQGVGFCVHFLNFRLQARTLSITYSSYSSQGMCYVELTPNNPTLVKVAFVRPKIHIGINSISGWALISLMVYTKYKQKVCVYVHI